MNMGIERKMKIIKRLYLGKHFIMKKIFLVAIATACLFSSCYKDNNNYDQQDVNTLKIETDAESYQVEQTKTLKIQPKLTSTIDGAAVYDFEWKLLSETEESVLSTAATLEEKIDAIPGKYTLLLTATDQKTKVRSYKTMTLTVNSTLYNGYYVAYNRNGKGSLGFVRQDGEVFYDVEKEFSKIELQSKIHKVYTAIIKNLRLIFISTEDNIYRLHGDNLFANGNSGNMFPSKISVGTDFYAGMNYIPNSYPTDIFLINAGKPYANIGPDFGGSSSVYSDPLSYDQEYEMFPFVATTASYASLFYDNKIKKFLRMGYSTRNLLEMTSNAANKFDPSNVGKIAIAAIPGQNNEIYYIMKDPANNTLSIYTIEQYIAAAAKGKQDIDLQQVPEFDKAQYYSAVTDRPLLYYATENKLYLYDFRTSTSKLVLQLSSDEKLADVQVHHKKVWENIEQPEYNKQIVLAINKADKGEIRLHTIHADGTLELTPLKAYTGFGQIADIDYRNPNN